MFPHTYSICVYFILDFLEVQNQLYTYRVCLMEHIFVRGPTTPCMYSASILHKSCELSARLLLGAQCLPLAAINLFYEEGSGRGRDKGQEKVLFQKTAPIKLIHFPNDMKKTWFPSNS